MRLRRLFACAGFLVWLVASPAAAAPNLCFYDDVDLSMPLGMEWGTPPDSSSPAEWIDGQLHIFNSALRPTRAVGPNLTGVMNGNAGVEFLTIYGPDIDRWVESTWRDPASGALFAWYHHEQDRSTYGCGSSPWSGSLSFPDVGAMVFLEEYDVWLDLGIVLQANPATEDCDALNGDFSGGHGDPTVWVGPSYVYFYFTNYGGPVETQGITAARMARAHLLEPLDPVTGQSRVQKWYNGSWQSPGLGGPVSPLTPAFAAKVSYSSSGVDSFWGPNIHYNRQLQKYVMFLNRTLPLGTGMYGQEGIYVSFSTQIHNPASWSTPRKMFLGFADWYPQILGLGAGDTDKRAGASARFFMHGFSGGGLQFFDDAQGIPPVCTVVGGVPYGGLLPP